MTHDVRDGPHLNFSEATGLFQTNLSQLGTICLQTRNTKCITASHLLDTAAQEVVSNTKRM